MKSFKYIAIGIFFTLGAFFAVTYSSCSKDGCTAVICQNKSDCGGGVCSCKPGTSGGNCEIVYRNTYNYTYQGNVLDSNGHVDGNNSLTFVPTWEDTLDFRTMHVDWKYGGTLVLSMKIKLDSMSSSGSSYIIERTPANNFIYSGSGTITPFVASMNLLSIDSVGVPRTYHFYSFARQ